MSSLDSEKHLIDKILYFSSQLPKELIDLEPHVLIKLMRKRLRLTQKQLAMKAKIPQSYIAKIESGNVKPTFSKLKNIFHVLQCHTIFILFPIINPEEILKNQAYKAAKKNVSYILGTMSLEKQKPDSKTIEQMVKEEQQRLLKSKTSKIWDI